uniref:Candidate secreted effector n=1 Tax=Meloidogyne incognita TaxID=6306 RepID=A0A914KIB4_MELIC
MTSSFITPSRIFSSFGHSTPVSVNAVSALLCLFMSSEMLVAGKSARSAVAALWTAVFCKHSFIGSSGSERLKNVFL